MSVIFKSFDQIEIDGVLAGNIVDVISNHGPRRLQVLEAHKTHTDKLTQDHATALAEVQADLETATSQLEATTQAKTTLEAQVATLTDQLNLANNTLRAVEKTAMELGAKVTELEQYRPYHTRILAGKAFYNRVSKEDMVTLLTSENAMLVTVGKTIEAYRAHNWPVILDSTDFQNLVGYVLQSGVFDADEVTEIMRDATKDEAYE
jgi:uncharacterized protein YoxC